MKCLIRFIDSSHRQEFVLQVNYGFTQMCLISIEFLKMFKMFESYRLTEYSEKSLRSSKLEPINF